MQTEAFDAALRLILPGPGDQPLMRLLRIAAALADCPIAYIGARRDDGFDIIVSLGVPLAEFRTRLPRSDTIGDRLQAACVIEDLAQEAAWNNHPFVHGPMQLRFQACVPLPLTMLPFPVQLVCADPRTGVIRRPDILKLLEESAAVAAEDLRLIGDIAVQSERLMRMRETTQQLVPGVMGAGVPMALLDSRCIVRHANPRFTALLAGLGLKLDGATALPDLFPLDADVLRTQLLAVDSSGTAAHAVMLRAPGKGRTVLADILRINAPDPGQPSLLCTLTDRTRIIEQTDRLAEPAGDSPTVISDFLLSTIVRQKRVLKRGDVTYHTLARWRAAARDVQIAALRAIKRDPSGHFVDTVGDELAAAATSLFGSGTFGAVVPVPCGNSGPMCLALRLATRVAERLGVPLIEAFEPIAVTGSSHPKRNLTRPKMTLAHAPTTPVLLIDDVATSGAHIAEATQLLRQSAPAVLPIAWIGG